MKSSSEPRISTGLLMIILMMSLMSASGSALASTLQLASIDFKSGHPRLGESLVEATSYGEDMLYDVLETNARALRDIPELGAEIAGYSDNRECTGQECAELSLRRASLVHQWLIEHGVPTSKLKGPVGAGQEFPLAEGPSPKERQLNRRVQFNLFTVNVPLDVIH